MTDQPIVFLDTETDGVHPGRRVWEVAMIRREPNGLERDCSFYVDMDLSTADPFGLKIGRFYDRHPQGRWFAKLGGPIDYPTPSSYSGGESNPTGLLSRRHAALVVAQWTHAATIIGMCPNFDTECLSWMLQEHGLTPGWHYSLVDVETMAAGFLLHLERENVKSLREVSPDAQLADSLATLPFSSEKISHALYVDPPSDDHRHTAMGDARWVQRMYDKMTEPV